jgi:oligopeptide transport system ATP-binding protein
MSKKKRKSKKGGQPSKPAKTQAKSTTKPQIQVRPQNQAAHRPAESLPNTKPTILEVENLRTTFHTPNGPVYAVQGLSFQLRRGEILGIVGESGSGKSVTNLALMGLIRPPGKVEASRISFQGQNLLELDASAMRKIRGNRIAMIFQDPMTSLNPFLSVGDQISESLILHKGMSAEAAFQHAAELLAQVGIPDHQRRVLQYPHEFSGGMRQRVMIAMALACDPDLLIADEPTTALDVTIQAQILDLLQNLRRQRDMAVILITHDMGVVAGLCDRVMVMYSGRVVEANDTTSLFAAPAHPYTEALLRSIPRLDGDPNLELEAIPGTPPKLDRLPQGCPFAPRCRYREARCESQVPALTRNGNHGLKACDIEWRKEETRA